MGAYLPNGCTYAPYGGTYLPNGCTSLPTLLGTYLSNGRAYLMGGLYNGSTYFMGGLTYLMVVYLPNEGGGVTHLPYGELTYLMRGLT